MALTVGTGAVRPPPRRHVQLRAPAHEGSDLVRGLPAAHPRALRRRDDRRQPPREAAARARAPPDLLLPAGGGPHGPARALRQAHDLPVQGRGVVLVGPGRRQGGGGRGMELSRAARRRAAAGGLHGVLLEQDGRVARGGRAGDRPRRATPTTASTSSTRRATCVSPWTARRSPTRRGPGRCSRPACRPAGTSRARTCAWTCSRPPTPAPAAPTRAIASYWSRAATRRTSCGHIPTRGREVARIKDYLAFFNERVDIEVDGELQERPVTQWSKGRRTPAAASS